MVRSKDVPPIEKRECDKCKHHKYKNEGLYCHHYCDSWQCEYEPKEEKSDE